MVFRARFRMNDFETCVLRGDRECRYLEGETHEGIGDHRRQSLFFCGHSDACTGLFRGNELDRKDGSASYRGEPDRKDGSASYRGEPDRKGGYVEVGGRFDYDHEFGCRVLCMFDSEQFLSVLVSVQTKIGSSFTLSCELCSVCDLAYVSLFSSKLLPNFARTLWHVLTRSVRPSVVRCTRPASDASKRSVCSFYPPQIDGSGALGLPPSGHEAREGNVG
uniref:Uncharacterized protein n=1 Tax=Timema monikensis TaxID=170555 RepID=A0A7R9EIN2_9NEOP|nr:unnamed protein product [Timema monikensis]